MIASPGQGQSKSVRPADRYVVLLGGIDGTAPTLSYECRWLVPTSVSISMGADRLDTLECRVDVSRGGKRLQNTTAPVGFRRQVELRRVDDAGVASEIVTWGMLVSDGQSIGETEGETITARLDHCLFGDVLHDTPYHNPVTGETIYVHLPAVLNPTIDDVFTPNMSDAKNATRGNSPVFFHPESHRLKPASDLQGQKASAWTFADAVHWLCWHLNHDEKYITNPTIDELQPMFGVDGAFPRIRNVELKYGRSLPQLLDDLLTPFGFAWTLWHYIQDDVRKTKFRFFKRGQGMTVDVFLQKIGSKISFAKTNVSQLSVDYDIARLANEVVGQGEFKLFESTFQLVPAWAIADDTMDIEKLETGSPEAIEKRDIGRKYVWGEAGDYNNVRQWMTGPVPALDAVIGSNHVIRRRRFRPCISQHASSDDETSNGYVLEWWDQDETSAVSPTVTADPGWVKVKHPFQVLEKECGIMFTGATPPVEMFKLFGESTTPAVKPLHLRVTCSVESDERVAYTATRRSSSPNGETVPLFLELHDRFKFREVKDSSKFTGQDSDAKDDSTDLETFVKKVRDNNDQAEVSVGLTLQTSNHPEYEIGQLIGKVAGRNLTFNANGSGANQRPLQIVGINRQLDGEQHTQLLLESFELERRELQVAT